MLSRNYINKVARITSQIGELRPGFLQDEATPLEGAVEPCYSVGRKGRAKKLAGRRPVKVDVEFETDESTGEIRTVLK
jgi:hypothetical protein